jgi:hypothetical protein
MKAAPNHVLDLSVCHTSCQQITARQCIGKPGELYYFLGNETFNFCKRQSGFLNGFCIKVQVRMAVAADEIISAKALL